MYSDISNAISIHRKHINELGVVMNSVVDMAENFERYDLTENVEQQRSAMQSFYFMELDYLDRISVLEQVLHGNLTATVSWLYPIVRSQK